MTSRNSVPGVLLTVFAVVTLAAAGSLLPAGRAGAAEGKKSNNPLSGDPKAIAEGMQLFRSGPCGHCHGMFANGRGRGAPNAANLQKFKRGYSAFLKTVKEGWRTMPQWGGGLPLSDEQLDKIGAWLESLAQPEADWQDPEGK